MQTLFDGLSYVNPLNLMGKGPPPPPLLAVTNLTPTQQNALGALQAEFPSCAPGELLGYLKVRNWKVAEAAAQRHSTLHWAPTICPRMHDIAPFLLGPPDGCIVLLEDCRGGCARDRLGRPVIASIGMLHGSLLDMQCQMVYALRRAQLYYKDAETITSNCVVIEVLPRPGAVPTFRFPDTNTKLLMEMQKTHFPGTLSSTTHFCGIPTAITWAFALCKPFMEAEAYNNMVLKPDYSHLPAYIDKPSLLKEWGGDLDFDLSTYVAWRLAEEGVGAGDAASAAGVDGSDGPVPATAAADHLAHTLTALSLSSSPTPTPMPTPAPTPTPTQHALLSKYTPRRFDPAHQDDTAATMEQAFLHTPSSTLSPQASLSTTLSKRGNGQGFFSSYKWKEKLVMLLPGAGAGGVLVYFDKLDVAEDNCPSKVVALAAGVYVEINGAEESSGSSKSGGGRPFEFTVVTPSRNFTFAATSDEQRSQWARGIKEAVSTLQAAPRG